MFEPSPAWPHGRLTQAFDEVFVVVGTNRTRHEGVDLQTSRTMLVLREGDALTLVNSVRLGDDGLAELDALGHVRHVVRLGAFHGRDDPFYRDRYAALVWALPGVVAADGRAADRELAADAPFPAHGGQTFVFASAAHPEAAVVLPREGGILVTCDAVQNWTHVDPFFSEQTGAPFTRAGLVRAANIPSTWVGACRPDVDDFRRLLALPFRHLITAHGEPLRDDAHALLEQRVAETF